MRFRDYFVIAFLIISCINFNGCLNQDGKENNNNLIDTLNIGMTDKIFGFYPFIDSYDISTMEINFNIYDSLVDFDENYRITPRLALSWNNPDQNIWRFNLRENVTFHNNYIFSAEDVKYSIEFIKNDSSSVLKDLISSIKDVVIINDYKIDIITDGPNPILLNKLVDIPIISKKYFESADNTWPIGTGAYKLVEYIENKTIKLEKFNKYWGNKVEFEIVIFNIIENDQYRENMLISGEIDIAENIPPIYIDEINDNKFLSVITIPGLTVVYLCFDFREYDSYGYPGIKNPTSDVRVRKAIYYALDRKAIIDDIRKGYAESASQFLSPLIFGYNPDIEILDYNINKSIDLLEEAGYENSFNITLDCPEDWYDDEIICEEIVEQLSPIINVTLNPLPLDKYFNKILSRESSFYIIGWIPATGDGGEIFDYILRSVDDQKGYGTYNLGYYSNSSIDELSDKIMVSMNPEDRLEKMQDGFKIAMDDVACIPIFINVLNYGVRENIDWNPRSDMDIRVESIKIKQ